MVLNKLTVITPIRIDSRHRYKEACVSMASFYRSLSGQSFRHLIAPANHRRYNRRFLRFMQRIAPQCEYMAHGASGSDAFIAMIEATETEYVFPLLADVKTLAHKDFVTPCIAAMERDPSLVQVRICGYPFSDAATNTERFYCDGDRICFDADRSISLDPIDVGQDTVWTFPMASETRQLVYPIPLWATAIRTSFLRRCFKALHSELKDAKHLTDLNDGMCGVSDPTTYLPISPKWPEHLSFIEDLRQGSLNLSCYMYALGREQKTEQQFREEQMREITKVPAEGKL